MQVKNAKHSSSVTDASLKVAPTPAPPPEVDNSVDDIPESTGPVFVEPNGSIRVEPVEGFTGAQEAILRKVGIDPLAASIAGIKFEGNVATPAPRFSGGLYQPPAFKANLKMEDRLIVVPTLLDAVAGDAHGFPCVAMQELASGIPEGLLKLLGDRALVLVRHSGENQAMRNLEQAIRKDAPTVVVVVVTCPPVESFKTLNKDDVVSLGVWMKLRTPGAVSSAISKAIRERCDEISPSRVMGGFVALGYNGKACTVFSLSRNLIIDLSANELKNAMSLAQAVGSKFIKSNYLRVAADTKVESIDVQSLGLDIVGQCDEIGQFRGDRVYGAGVWRGDDGQLIVNSKVAFHPNGKLAKRIVGDSIYVAARDLGITPSTREATADEAQTAFEFFDAYQYEKRGGALIVFGHVMNTFTAGANEWRQWLLLTGMPGAGKSTVMLFAKSLLGDAADIMVGGSEAGMRHGAGMDSLGLFWDEAEADETNKAEIRKMFSNLRKAAKGGVENRGSTGGTPVQHAVKSQAMLAANKFPELKGADITRMVSVKMLEITKHTVKPHSLVPNAKAGRFPAVEALGKKLFVRMLRANDRYLLNLKAVSEALDTSSVRAADTLGPAIAASFTALYDQTFDADTAARWLREFDLNAAVAEIESAQATTGIIEHISRLPVPSNRLAHGTLPCTMLDLWHLARQGEGAAKANAIASLAVMGMSVQPGGYRGALEVRFFPKRAGLQELFRGTEWQNEDLTRALLNDPRTDNKLSNRTAELRVESARLKAFGAQTFTPAGDDAKRLTGERFVSLTLHTVDEIEEAKLERAASIAVFGDPVAEWKAANPAAEETGAVVVPADAVLVIEKTTATV